MFRKVDVPVLGIIENMATHCCSACGHEEPIFGAGGGEQMATEYGVELLAQLPLSMRIRETADRGVPMLTVAADDPGTQGFVRAAAAIRSKLDASVVEAGPIITMGDE